MSFRWRSHYGGGGEPDRPGGGGGKRLVGKSVPRGGHAEDDRKMGAVGVTSCERYNRRARNTARGGGKGDNPEARSSSNTRKRYACGTNESKEVIGKLIRRERGANRLF